MIHANTLTKGSKASLAILLVSAVIFFLPLAYAQPTGVDIQDNITDSMGVTSPSNRTDEGGTITTLTLDVLQQNIRWKAYVGNLSGVLTLDDSSGQSIFQWQMGAQDLSGEIFVSRSDAIDWDNIECSNETVIESEQTFLGLGASSVDNINRTFNETTHPELTIGLVTLTQDTCRSQGTYVNNTAQSIASADFPIVLLASDLDVVFATPINSGSDSYNTGEQVDFQIIVPNNPADTTTYFFYAQIS